MRNIFLLLFLISNACTINIIQTDTHGVASDVVDDTNEEQVDPSLSVPVKPF